MFNSGSISTTSIAADSGGSTKYAQYTYLGLSRIIKTEHPTTNNNLTLAYSLGSAGQYSGLDRFGRIGQKLWKKGIFDGLNHDGCFYTCDRNSAIVGKDCYGFFLATITSTTRSLSA